MSEILRRWFRRSARQPLAVAPQARPIPGQDKLSALIPLFASLLQDAGFAAHAGDDCVFFADLDLQLSLTPIRSFAGGETAKRLQGFKLYIFSNTLFDSGLSVEYAYGQGKTHDEIAVFSLRSWIAHDFPVIHDALRGQNKFASVLEFRREAELPEGPATLRVYLGPMYFYSKAAGVEPCCDGCMFVGIADVLMTRTQPGWKSCGVKLFASKTADGHVEADCRIDGEDWEIGQKALISHAGTWDVKGGIVIRRQYLYFQAPRSLTASTELGIVYK